LPARRRFLRNAVLVVGSYYVSSLVLLPLLILWFKLLERPGGTLPLDWWVQFVPMLGNAILTGLLCGYLLKSPNKVAWSLGTAVLFALAIWSSVKWYLKPSTSEILWHVTTAIVAGAVASLVCWISWRRRERRDSEAPVAAT
jgi:hypothetical protein